MQEIVRMVADKTGIPEDKARQATETVIGYLKDKLPPAVSSQLDNVAAGGAGGGNLGDIAGNLGGRLGGRE